MIGERVFLQMLRINGVKLGSVLDGEVRAMGLIPKTLPCVIRRNGTMGDVDNIPCCEWADYVVDCDNDGLYLDRDSVLECISIELANGYTPTYAQLEQVRREDAYPCSIG